MTEPSSLHPLIDLSLCLGCGACTRACPEGDILGLIAGKAQLIQPSHCIGHGACKTACPMDAISLVFGTEKRGVDIPLLSPDFQTNVEGIYIAGELGGMGLIRNAITQGQQAVEAIANASTDHTCDQDLLIVGAGPAGISASLKASEMSSRYLTIEQDSMGGTVAHFPRNKIVMTEPIVLPIIGKVKFTEISKETLLAFWQKIIHKTGLQIDCNEQLESVEPIADGFKIRTSKRQFSCHKLLLCLGRRGTPRKLDVPGEDLAKVTYRLIDPEQFQGQHVLVVGGGDSALEAATSIAEQANTKVTIVYRSAAFSRAKPKNIAKIQAAEKAGTQVLFSSKVRKIDNKTITVEKNGTVQTFKNDQVIICAGGILPTPFLKHIGINIETKHGTL